MYDTVIIRCPHCNESIEEQTKSGDCICATYTINTAPDEVLAGISGYDIICSECDGWFRLKANIVMTTITNM